MVSNPPVTPCESEQGALDLNSSNVVYIWHPNTSQSNRPGDPADGCCLGSRAQRSRIKIRDYPRGQADLNGTGLSIHPVLGGLDRASSVIAPGMTLPPASLQSRPIAPNPPAHSALRCRPNSNHPPTPFQPSCSVFSLRSSIARVVCVAHLSAEGRVPPGARGRIAPRKAIARRQ